MSIKDIIQLIVALTALVSAVTGYVKTARRADGVERFLNHDRGEEYVTSVMKGNRQ